MTAGMVESVRIRPALALAVIGVAWLAVHADSCLARGGDQHPTTLRRAVTGEEADDGRNASMPPVAHYVAGDGDRFILDKSGPVALLRFEHAEEIWALRPTPGPNGDTIYRNDIGQPVLRFTRLGGLTLFTPHQPWGEAVSVEGLAPVTRMQRGSLAMLVQAHQNAILHIGRAMGHKFTLEAEGQGAEWLFADSLNILTDTVEKLAALRDGRPYLNAIREIHLHPAKRMDARLHNGVLDIAINPSEGIAGRPSSGRIAQAIVNPR
ncbi:MAG TPA: DUF4908 domain-containing protein [Caulobacteraceae bacterium]|jgi:hypothetical protein|nr:DUF4908 domain-containing protein [Caulobacteraceae bacterium]